MVCFFFKLKTAKNDQFIREMFCLLICPIFTGFITFLLILLQKILHSKKNRYFLQYKLFPRIVLTFCQVTLCERCFKLPLRKRHSCKSHPSLKRIQAGWNRTFSPHRTSGLTHPSLRIHNKVKLRLRGHLNQSCVVHPNQNDSHVRRWSQ